MGEASEAVALALHVHAGGEDGGSGATGGWESGSTGSLSASSGIGTASTGSSSSLFSSTSSVGDDDEGGDGATSSRPADRRRFSSSLSSSLSSLSSSTSSESEALQMNGAAGGPLYGMSTMRDHLPPARSRTGLSKYYEGRSESFTSLANVSCLEDLAKKTTPYIRRPRRHTAALGVKNRLSKTVAAKKAPSGRKPAAASECQGKRELYRC